MLEENPLADLFSTSGYVHGYVHGHGIELEECPRARQLKDEHPLIREEILRRTEERVQKELAELKREHERTRAAQELVEIEPGRVRYRKRCKQHLDAQDEQDRIGLLRLLAGGERRTKNQLRSLTGYGHCRIDRLLNHQWFQWRWSDHKITTTRASVLWGLSREGRNALHKLQDPRLDASGSLVSSDPLSKRSD